MIENIAMKSLRLLKIILKLFKRMDEKHISKRCDKLRDEDIKGNQVVLDSDRDNMKLRKYFINCFLKQERKRPFLNEAFLN